MKNLYIVILSALILSSCIEPIDIDTPENVNVLTVEGFITTENGPHIIRLTRSARYGSIYDANPARVEEAAVAIRDNDGSVTFLEEKENGNYQTPTDFKAEVGKSYSLLIQTEQGQNYISFPEKVTKAPELKEITYSYEEIPTQNENINIGGLTIYASFQDDPDAFNYYLFRNKGVFQLEARPDLHVLRIQGQIIPDPKSCCFTCYVQEEPDDGLSLVNDRLFNGESTRQEIAFLEDDGYRFTERYMLISSISSLTKEAYQYLRLVNNQLSIDGDIFDPPPSNIKGNLINLDSIEEQVLGYFAVIDVSSDTTFLDLSKIGNPITPQTYQDDCRLFNSTATINPPSNW